MTGLLICLHLSWTTVNCFCCQLPSSTVFVVIVSHCVSSLDFEVCRQKNRFCYLLSTQILFPMTLSAVIISKVSSSYGFKCACVVDVPQLRKSSSWVKQEASLLIWASWLISLVLIYRRRLGVIPSLVFPLPLWMVQVTKGLPHTVAGAVWSLHAETQGGVSTNLL